MSNGLQVAATSRLAYDRGGLVMVGGAVAHPADTSEPELENE